MFRLLFVSLLTGLWQSLEVAQCQNIQTYTNLSHCYNTSSGKTCFTAFLTNDSRPVKRTFIGASDWCKVHVAGSSLIVIDSLENKGIVDVFIRRQVLENETIFMDARKLSADKNVYWSWVNGHPSIPTDVKTKAKNSQDAACLEWDSEQQLVFCAGNDSELLHYICEYSDSRRTLSYRHNNSYYFASEEKATWYEARNECLRLRGQLASITDLNMIRNWSQLKESKNKRFWIGLHRNKWIWNSTGAAITYTNWEGGYPDDVYDRQCICINPKCKSINNRYLCEDDRKWWSCNCDQIHSIVCQREEETYGAVTTDFTGEMLPSTSSTPTTAITPTTTQFQEVTPDVTTYIETIVNNIVPESDITTVSTSSLIPNLSTHFSEDQTNAFTTSSSTADFNSATTKKTLLILLCVVGFILIIVACVLVIRKRKHDKRNEASHMENTKQCEAVTSQYATVVPDNRPPEATAPTACPIYADVEMTQPSTPSNNTIYASVQSTSETIDMGKSVVYADLNLPRKDQQKPSSTDKVPVSLSPIYSQSFVPPISMSSSEYAEPFKPDNQSAATAPVPNHYYNIAAVDQHNV